MEENFITIEERDIFKVYLKYKNGTNKKDEKGNDLYLEFDLDDVDLPLKWNRCEFLIRKAFQDLKWKFIAIDKKQDVKGKFALSKNEEDKFKAVKDYFNEMENAMDLFLGKGGTKKIFGDTKYYEMFDDLAKMLEPIMPILDVNIDKTISKIEKRYKNEDKDVLKNE